MMLIVRWAIHPNGFGTTSPQRENRYVIEPVERRILLKDRGNGPELHQGKNGMSDLRDRQDQDLPLQHPDQDL